MENEVVMNNVTDEQTVENTNFMLKRLISDYLAKLNLPTMEEILAKVNEVDQPGILNSMQVKLLQCMIKDYYKANGQSIELVAKEKEITLKEGELSSLEKECLDKILADYCQKVIDSVEQPQSAE